MSASAAPAHTTTMTTTPLPGSRNWEPIRQRLVGLDLSDALAAAQELKSQNLSTHELPLLLSALLPAFGSVLTHRTRPNLDTTSVEYKLRMTLLEIVVKFPHTPILRPHAPHLVALALDILQRDFQEPALLASRILFDLYKAFRTLPQDNVQPYLDLVVSMYRNLPTSVRRNFSVERLVASTTSSPSKGNIESKESEDVEMEDVGQQQEESSETIKTASSSPAVAVPVAVEAVTAFSDAMQIDGPDDKPDADEQPSATPEQQASPALSATASTDSITSMPSLTASKNNAAPEIRSMDSFRILTECPLVVMLMFQLYPKFLKTNIPILIRVMMDALSIRPPPLTSLQTSPTAAATAPALSTAPPSSPSSPSSATAATTAAAAAAHRWYATRVAELVAAQAKTLSFLTYLLRSFAHELAPFYERLALVVVQLLSLCPRKTVATRKELLVATRHLLNAAESFGTSLLKHVDQLLDERVLLGGTSSGGSSGGGGSSSRPVVDPSLSLRPLAYTALSDLIQQTRASLSLQQLSKVVLLFGRMLHDGHLPLATQYAAIRTLLGCMDAIYNHTEVAHVQVGRDLLVRLLHAMVERLESLPYTFRSVQEAERMWHEKDRDVTLVHPESDAALMMGHDHHHHHVPPDTIRDVQSMIRAIIVGHKTLLVYIHTYRNQHKEKLASASPPTNATNEEVASAGHKWTHTELALVDRYILSALQAMKLLTVPSVASSDAADAALRSGEKPLSEQYRDALTYFAAAFTSLDGYTLRRTLGCRLDVLVEAMEIDAAVLVVPRHLLAANATTSFEFCGVLLQYLVEHMDDLASPRTDGLLFFDKDPSEEKDALAVVGDKAWIRRMMFETKQRPERSSEMLKARGATLLQLFERVLKSLSVYADNEASVRLHLRKIVVVCLRNSLEQSAAWPDNYCMLLRYIFRSISAGKFEESYKVLLPLIPTVLNGLYRVVVYSQNPIVRHISVELCLTIPARLSSLLPHMNLLLRVIVPSLNADSGDLVNLGLRTLEFWIDNLNPKFLYPEMSKETGLLSCLMQALSRHLRPAPYPYGLLTLRLLGKLGGKNRQFLREAIPIYDDDTSDEQDSLVSIRCAWKAGDEPSNSNIENVEAASEMVNFVEIPVPLSSCARTLELIALACPVLGNLNEDANDKREVMSWADPARLWSCHIENIDLAAYSLTVMEDTHKSQADACLILVEAAVDNVLGAQDDEGEDDASATRMQHTSRYQILSALLYASSIEQIHERSWELLKKLVFIFDATSFAEALVKFLSVSSGRIVEVGLDFVRHILSLRDAYDMSTLYDALLSHVCEACNVMRWGQLPVEGLQETLCLLVKTLGMKWARQYEIKLLFSTLQPIRTIPSEFSAFCLKAVNFFVNICAGIYGPPTVCEADATSQNIFWDMLNADAFESIDATATDVGESKLSDRSTEVEKVVEIERKDALIQPCDEVFSMIMHDLASARHIVRVAARYMLTQYIVLPSDAKKTEAYFKRHSSLIRRVLFSRSLRLLALPQQVGAVEGLTAIMIMVPGILPLQDQNLLAFLSEVLKMASVADGEMTDPSLKEFVVDRNGYAGSASELGSMFYPTQHASALFFRRECALEVDFRTLIVPQEHAVGVQLRVSAILLVHAVIKAYPDSFFDAKASTPIGNIRPHVVSLLFRSLVSVPPDAVLAAHHALRDVLALSESLRSSGEKVATKNNGRLPKELLQTCIRPVLLNLREHTQLNIPLMRGLSRLLVLLSSWFNTTLGEKLLDHLQKWTDPNRIIAMKVWREGGEPLIAAALVSIFPLLPHASQFVEPLVKTCIKLEATLPAYKPRFVGSPYRRPLVLYLNKHPQHAVSFFFQRLKTPIYSETFQALVKMKEASPLREYLANKQCSVMLLKVCFETPLAIIRSEKNASGNSIRSGLQLHGIAPTLVAPLGADEKDAVRAMTTEALELQHQGFRLIETLANYQLSYFTEHNDIVRAFRWLWRSKGRYLRLQHEDLIPPRYLNESRFLSFFLMSYSKATPNEDLDILFELIRVFLQSSTSDFSYIARFLSDMVSKALTLPQSKQVLSRFFSLLSGDSSEETKVLATQFLISPMLCDSIGECSAESGVADDSLVDHKFVSKIVAVVITPGGRFICSGDRLKVELLRLLHFLSLQLGCVEPFKKDIMKYCWNLLRSDDISCKSWAYYVVSKLISAFETPAKFVAQVYIALLRSHHQENRELIRGALNCITDAFPRRLSDLDRRALLIQACQLLLEEGHSVPQLAHLSLEIVRHPNVFEPYQARIVDYLIGGLSRLALPPNCPLENKILAVDLVAMIMNWDLKAGKVTYVLSITNQGTIANFLVRLWLAIAEPADRSTKGDVGSQALDHRISDILRDAVMRWTPNIREQPFEKVVSGANPSVSTFVVCLDIFSILAVSKKGLFFLEHGALASSILAMCFAEAQDNLRLRSSLENFGPHAIEMDGCMGKIFIVSLEKIFVDAISEQKKIASNRGTEAGRQAHVRARDKSSSPEELSDTMPLVVSAVEMVAALSTQREGIFNKVASVLLSLASAIAKVHMLDAAAKQRQGSAPTSRFSIPGILANTPIRGILDEACFLEPSNIPKTSSGRARTSRDMPESLNLRCLVIILRLFEISDLPFNFTPHRKVLFQTIGSLLDTSDDVQVLMISARIAGKWLISDGPAGPVTPKERNSFLWKISSFDFNGIGDDVTAQPLADLVAYFVSQLSSRSSNFTDRDELVVGRSLVSCLLNANETARKSAFTLFFGESGAQACTPWEVLWRMLHSDFECLGGRFWIVALVEGLLRSFESSKTAITHALGTLSSSDSRTCQKMFSILLPEAWKSAPNDATRLLLVKAIEILLSRPFHSQFIRADETRASSSNAVRAFLRAIPLLTPTPILDCYLLVSAAENHNSWYEVATILEQLCTTLPVGNSTRTTALQGLRHCYRHLKEQDILFALAEDSCSSAKSLRALSLDSYGVGNEALEAYQDLVELVERSEQLIEPSVFEMDFWEERWVELQREMCQLEVVADYASTSENPRLELDCAWKAQDWTRVKFLCASPSLLAAVEIGDPMVKMSETLLAVADGKLSDVENLHAQTAQLCLYKWQLLPRLSSSSLSHASLLHFFHRLVEIRESGQIMVETNTHSAGRTLPDLKNLLNAWRHRLPNDYESITLWDDVIQWRANMFNAISSSFTWADPNRLATLHDRPWTAIRMAKTARKQGLREVAMLQLNKTAEERAMNVSDAFIKLREQILAYDNPESELERHGGLNLINTTNLSFFDTTQKGELFRLKAKFLASLGGRSKANQAFCHSVQICPTHGRAWDSWGGLCAALGAVAERQVEQTSASPGTAETKESILAALKKVAQYLAQAMGCYIEAVQIDPAEWGRIHLPKCLWMLTKDGASPGVLCSTFESRGSHLPAWVWLPWVSQMLTCLYRQEGKAIKSIFGRVVRSYPQAVYYPLRAFYLERRDVERAKAGASSSSSAAQQMGSVGFAEEMMSLLRRSHAGLWSSLESILEELLVKFRNTHEEELLATIIALLERAESHAGSSATNSDEMSVVGSVWKTLGKIAVKYFRPSETVSGRSDLRLQKSIDFKEEYRADFETDFRVSASDDVAALSAADSKPEMDLDEILTQIRKWKNKLEERVLSTSPSASLVESSLSLATFGIGNAPDLWPGSCDPRHASPFASDREHSVESDPATTHSSASSSASAAKKAAVVAALAAASSANREGVGGDYGGGSSFVEVPGQYMPNTSAWADSRPCPELHPKLMRFEPTVTIMWRNDQLVRRIGMIGSDGKVYRFLLQCALPYWTRTDERAAQTHYVMDKFLRKSLKGSRAHLSAQPHAIIPIAQRLRLVSEADGRMSLEQICHDARGGDLNELDLPREFNEELKAALGKRKAGEKAEEEVDYDDHSVRLEVYDRISIRSEVESTVLATYLQKTLGGPEPYYQFRRMFAKQWALNCLIQYTFSITERTPGRVVFIERDGTTLMPDARIMYNSQGGIESHPVPFRMSPNLATAIGFPFMNGIFVRSMATAAGVIVEFKSEMDPILRLLMRDDLIAYYTKSVAKSDNTTQEMEKQLMDRISKNVAYVQGRFESCAPRLGKDSVNEDPLDLHVRDLVDVAQRPENVCMMPPVYQGWI